MKKNKQLIMVSIAVIAPLVMFIVCGRRQVLAEEEAARQAAIEAAYNDSIEAIEYA
ncbi:MAG: hypothetical protein K2H04_05195 [Bacteroidaceae bacterium]|nr:hypothetical protein [Bacteroidaceae bacterium]